jgi:tetratricopeptide (TPR) repeat protein
MDEKRIKDLLEGAGREYNQGKYAEAIAHWQEVLSLDPGNQKAREGIRMAQLLVVNWEATESDVDEGTALLPADTADAETQQKIDVGIARVRELLAAGRSQEALEGCQLLAELAPGMASVRQLQEEVTQAHEAQPLIKERLDRAKRFLAQGKQKEAADEARNILSVDRNNQQAQVILDRATGSTSADSRPKAPSAFQVDRAGKEPPPSPFSGRAAARNTDALLAQFDFEPDAPGAAKASPQEASQPPAPPAATDSESKIRPLIDEGQKLFSQKKYQAAIEVWSRVFAINETHAQAGVLIDRAKAVLEDLSRQADEAYFRAVDAFESGNMTGAKKAFEEVLAIHPDHADAQTYLKQVAENLAAGPRPAAKEPPPPPASAASEPQPAKPLSAKPAKPSDAELLSSSSVPLAVPSEGPSRSSQQASSTPPPSLSASSAGVIRKKPVTAVGSRWSLPVVAGGGLAIVALLGAAVWFFLLRGGPPPAIAPPPASAGNPSSSEKVSHPPAALEASQEAAPPAAPKGKSASLEVLPGNPPPGAAPSAPPDPAATRRKIDELMKEGQAFLRDENYTDALDRLDQVLALDPTNFDAVELKTKAAAGAQKAAKFNKELDAAKSAFRDGDWAGSLYKLYRLREERKDMAVLAHYIRNANFNWAIESLTNFEVDNGLDHFKDALEMDPGDPSIQKDAEIAGRYRRHARDAAFEAFVKALKPKGLDDK